MPGKASKEKQGEQGEDGRLRNRRAPPTGPGARMVGTQDLLRTRLDGLRSIRKGGEGGCGGRDGAAPLRCMYGGLRNPCAADAGHRRRAGPRATTRSRAMT